MNIKNTRGELINKFLDINYKNLFKNNLEIDSRIVPFFGSPINKRKDYLLSRFEGIDTMIYYKNLTFLESKYNPRLELIKLLK